MNTFLLVSTILLSFGLLSVIIFLWYQFNSTDSRLFQIIENRINLARVSAEQDNINSIDDIREDTDLE